MNTKNAVGAGCLTLFGAPFLAAGLFMIAMGAGPLVEARSLAEAWGVVRSVAQGAEGAPSGDVVALPIAGLAFLVAGLAASLTGLVGLVGAVRRLVRRLRFPGRPWRHDVQWERFEATSGGLGVVVAKWGGGLVFTLFPLPFAALIWLQPDVPKLLVAVPLLFLVAGGWLLVIAARSTVRLARVGPARLAFRVLPIEPGTRLEAVARVPGRLPTEPLKLTLSCERTRRRRSGNKTTWEVVTTWSHDATVEPRALRDDGEFVVLPVNVEVPASVDHGEATFTSGETWVLSISGPLSERWELPVFKLDSGAAVEYRTDPMPV